LTEKVKIIWVYLLSALFLAVNFYLVLEKDFYWFFLLPVVLIVFYYYLFSLDKIFLLITFLTPLAVNISDMEMGMGVSLPTEPLMLGVVLIFIANLIFENKYDKTIARHPVSYIIYFLLLWMLLTTLTSEYPIISLKHLLSQIWFIVPFYFVAVLVFKDKKNIRKFLWLYLIPLIAVVVYTISQHARYGFEEDAGHWVMSPFYNDHTAYGAALAIFYPVVIGLIFYPGSSKGSRIAAFLFTLIITVALILSYSRAAWISVAGAFIVFLLVLFKIRFHWVALGTVVIIGGFILFQQQIFDVLEKNKQDSSANFVEHIRSIANISSDASNLERINRWQAAIRMFEERPVLGWGPGTYQFVYAPFQLAKEKTIISTNLGDKGNAHSEYLGPLSEMGLPGLLLVLLLVVVVIYKGLMVYRRGNREVKFISLMITLGLTTYFIHGLLNNFLDTDKLAVPVWGYIAAIVALDIYHLKTPGKLESDEVT